MTTLSKPPRLDEYVARVNGVSRSHAGALIRGGLVELEGQVCVKPAVRIASQRKVSLRAAARYVSRGGEKLAAALAEFRLDPDGCRALDVGISTGGFTDCLLKHGARRVIGVDVGHGQTAASIMIDPRVRLIEGMNARLLSPAALDCEPHCFDLATIDVSFISLAYILPALRELITGTGSCIALFKPQFEVGREALGRNGIVRDAAVREAKVAEFYQGLPTLGWQGQAMMVSPIEGRHGNVEYLLLLRPAAEVSA